MTGPNDGGHWERAWAILRQNARDATGRAPKESPALLFLIVALVAVAFALYIAFYAGPLV